MIRVGWSSFASHNRKTPSSSPVAMVLPSGDTAAARKRSAGLPKEPRTSPVSRLHRGTRPSSRIEKTLEPSAPNSIETGTVWSIVMDGGLCSGAGTVCTGVDTHERTAVSTSSTNPGTSPGFRVRTQTRQGVNVIERALDRLKPLPHGPPLLRYQAWKFSVSPAVQPPNDASPGPQVAPPLALADCPGKRFSTPPTQRKPSPNALPAPPFTRCVPWNRSTLTCG